VKYNVSWLPDLVKYNGKTSFDEYYEAVYTYFKNDFVDSRPIFKGKNVGLQIEPKVNGKEQTFHHITTEGDEPNRKISSSRCERIRWNKAIIESDWVGLKIWTTKYPKNQLRTIIWFEQMDYMVVLREAKGYYVFITAYPIDKEHTKRKLTKLYDAYKKAETALLKSGFDTLSTHGR
jgi:hypothetical protein